jgi:hypothetical protein
LLGDFLNEKLPLFIFTNRISFKMCLHYQIGYYEYQRQIMVSQVVSIQRELEYMQNAKRFEMTDGMKEEFSSVSDEDWGELV